MSNGRINLRGEKIPIYEYFCPNCKSKFELLRSINCVNEVAFLAMDLDHYRRADLSQSFVNAYVAQSRDEELLRLLNFYKGYLAYVRGKVESFKLDDPYISEEEKTGVLAAARSYFDLAESYI